jgi:hypothetical protein
MSKPSRRLLVFVAALLLVCALPVAALAYTLGRMMFVPPVAGTRLAGYDGLRADGACASHASTHGGQVWVCNGSFRLSSRFVVVDHNSGAVAWCVEQVDEGHFVPDRAQRLGPLVVEPYPLIPSDWGNCTEMLPVQVGLTVDLILSR